MNGRAPRGHIAPLLWHHGEEPERIIREIEAIASSGIREFVLEPRPHPDYLGDRWWADVRAVIDAAKARDMRVWLWDDAHFPSGWLNGTVPSRHPELRKRHLGVRQIDVVGPLAGASFDLRPHLSEGLELVAVTVAPRDGDDGLESGALREVTDLVADKTLYWDVPSGRWRVMIFTVGHDGEEPETVDYVNPIAAGAAEAFLETVHERHYAHFADEFGGVIAGFFQDEPRFGNAATYEFALGRRRIDAGWQVRNDVLPFSDLLWKELGRRWGECRTVWLPLLWWSGDASLTARVRFDYMDAVTALNERFQRMIGEWCTSHGVELIGHVVEDNGAHARLGYGAGHYFRAMAGQQMGGIDVVQQIRPEVETGTRTGTFGLFDDEFYHWGLTKLASSAAHIDPAKHGRAMCEAFGAYGWHAGLRLMKQITDHLVVRGVNIIVPHAFSPRTWDPDCPPHFFNGGENPQWQHFPVWRSYAERLCARFSDGLHCSDAAVLYHAEAEWVGAAMPFQRVLRTLGREQRDADVIPIDALSTAEAFEDGSFRIGSETYPLLILPYAERQPAAVAEAVLRLNIRTVVVDGLPTGWADRVDEALARRFADAVEVVPLNRLTDLVAAPIATSSPVPHLRIMRYEKEGVWTAMLHNESVELPVETTLSLPLRPGHPVLEDLVLERDYSADVMFRDADRIGVAVRLAPGETRVLSFSHGEGEREPRMQTTRTLPRTGWAIVVRRFDSEDFVPAEFDELGPVNTPIRLPRFAGTVRYSREVDLTGVAAIDLGDVGETATVSTDGVDCGVRIAPPYRFDVPFGAGRVLLMIDVTTTLGPAAADNIFDATVALEPAGLLGELTLLGVSGASAGYSG